MSKREENKLRAEIYTCWCNFNVNEKQRLVGTFQEFAPAQISKNKPLGLTFGFSDFVFFGENSVGFIDVKFPGSSWQIEKIKRQAELMQFYDDNCNFSNNGYFVTSLDGAFKVFDQLNDGECTEENYLGAEHYSSVLDRIYDLEKQGRKTIKF